MIIYLAAQILAPQAVPSFRARQRLGRLRRVAAALEADDVSGGTQVISPHAQIADMTEHGTRPPLDLLRDHAQALLIGLARGAERHPVTVYVVDAGQAPTVAQQVAAAKDLGLTVERPDAGTLARLELGPSEPGGSTADVSAVDGGAVGAVGATGEGDVPSPEDRRLARMDVAHIFQLLRVYFEGADGVCGTGAIDYCRVGGGGAHRARAAQVVVGLQIAQARGVFEQARRDPRWRGQSRRGTGGAGAGAGAGGAGYGGAGAGGAPACVPMPIGERFAALRRTDDVVRLRHEGCSFGEIGSRLGCSKKAAQRTWSRASGALRDALADRVALRRAVEKTSAGVA